MLEGASPTALMEKNFGEKITDTGKNAVEFLEKATNPDEGFTPEELNSWKNSAVKAVGEGASELKKAAEVMAKEQSFKLGYLAFIQETVLALTPENFGLLRDMLTEDAPGILKFRYVVAEDITPEVMAEKLGDYFDKVTFKSGNFFSQQAFHYIEKLEAAVEPRIAKPEKSEAGDKVCRAREYYQKALEIKVGKTIQPQSLLDFSRIMFCLYTATLQDRLYRIEDFDLSESVIDPVRLVTALTDETTDMILGIKRKVFNFEDVYGLDSSAIVIATLALVKIWNDRAEGE